MGENPLPFARAAALSTLARNEDPLYIPALFLLGYIHLRRGESEQAREAFDPIIQPFERETEHAVALLRSRFVTRPRFLKLVRKSEIIRQWAKYFQRQITYLHGGAYSRAADTWQRIKTERAEEEAGRKSEFRTAHIQALAENLCKLWSPARAMDAAGLGTADPDEVRRAQRELDTFLRPADLITLDSNLSILGTQPAIIQLLDFSPAFETDAESEARKRQKAAHKASVLQDVGDLQTIPIGRLLADKIEPLKQLIQEERWDAFAEQIESIQQDIRSPDERKFADLLKDARVDSLGGRIVSFFLPAFAEVRKLRAYLRRFYWPALGDHVRLPLYTEASYYSLQAQLLTFDPDQMIKASEQAKEFREAYPSRSFNTSDVYLLMLSLEAEAILRAQIQRADPDTHLRATTIKPHEERLRKAVKSRRVESGTRASAYLALGLFQRTRRRAEEQARHRSALEDKSKDEMARYEEVELYLQSLDLLPSASAHCYIAECRLEEGRSNEAAAHVMQALSLSPEHALAKKLAVELRLSLGPQAGAEPGGED
jgi:hypothetical protein